MTNELKAYTRPILEDLGRATDLTQVGGSGSDCDSQFVDRASVRVGINCATTNPGNSGGRS